LLSTHGLPKPKTESSGTVETARTARLNKLKRDAVDVGKMEAALKNADGEKDEDVVLWKALLINNRKEKNNEAERRASEANSSLTEREALDFRAGYLTSITHHNGREGGGGRRSSGDAQGHTQEIKGEILQDGGERDGMKEQLKTLNVVLLLL